jgi:hypothetical protein
MMEENIYDPYCPVCGSFGEDGCCPATSCKQHPDGRYCQTHLAELKFGYKMYHRLMELIENDEKYKEQVDEIWDKLYDQTFYDDKEDK